MNSAGFSMSACREVALLRELKYVRLHSFSRIKGIWLAIDEDCENEIAVIQTL